MALDIRDKRASAIVIDKPYTVLLPLPDGSVDQPDRQQLIWTYSGIFAGVIAIVAIVLRQFRERWS